MMSWIKDEREIDRLRTKINEAEQEDDKREAELYNYLAIAGIAFIAGLTVWHWVVS